MLRRMSAKRWLNMTQRAMLKSMPDRAAAMLMQFRSDAELPEFEQRVLMGVGEAEVTVIDWLPALLLTPKSMQKTTKATLTGTVIVVAREGIFLVEPIVGALQAAIGWERVCRADMTPLPRTTDQVFAYAFLPPSAFEMSAVEAHYFYVAATEAFFHEIGSHVPEMMPNGFKLVPRLI